MSEQPTPNEIIIASTLGFVEGVKEGYRALQDVAIKEGNKKDAEHYKMTINFCNQLINRLEEDK